MRNGPWSAFKTKQQAKARFFLAKVANQKTLNLLARCDRVPLGRPSREDHEAVCTEHAHHSTTHLVLVGRLDFDVALRCHRDDCSLVLWSFIQPNIVYDLERKTKRPRVRNKLFFATKKHIR